jgi:hypothetical protein
MKRPPTVVKVPVMMTIAGSVLASSMCLAADPWHSFAAKRLYANQVIGCMRKRMSTDKYISYNQAAKGCKDWVAQQNEGTAAAAGPLVAADTKH